MRIGHIFRMFTIAIDSERDPPFISNGSLRSQHLEFEVCSSFLSLAFSCRLDWARIYFCLRRKIICKSPFWINNLSIELFSFTHFIGLRSIMYLPILVFLESIPMIILVGFLLYYLKLRHFYTVSHLIWSKETKLPTNAVPGRGVLRFLKLRY